MGVECVYELGLGYVGEEGICFDFGFQWGLCEQYDFLCVVLCVWFVGVMQEYELVGVVCGFVVVVWLYIGGECDGEGCEVLWCGDFVD